LIADVPIELFSNSQRPDVGRETAELHGEARRLLNGPPDRMATVDEVVSPVSPATAGRFGHRGHGHHDSLDAVSSPTEMAAPLSPMTPLQRRLRDGGGDDEEEQEEEGR
jgi:hypothetical protein